VRRQAAELKAECKRFLRNAERQEGASVISIRELADGGTAGLPEADHNPLIEQLVEHWRLFNTANFSKLTLIFLTQFFMALDARQHIFIHDTKCRFIHGTKCRHSKNVWPYCHCVS